LYASDADPALPNPTRFAAQPIGTAAEAIKNDRLVSVRMILPSRCGA